MYASLVLVAALVTQAQPAKKVDPIRAADTWVTNICRTYGADSTNGWAMAHAVGAFGPSFKASDGRLAIDAIVDDFLQKKGSGADARYSFPEYSDAKSEKPVDPHADHTVAVLLHSGVPLMRVFKTKVGDVTLGELAESIKRGFAFESTDTYWREHPWTVDAIAAVTRERSSKFSNAQGKEFDLNAVLDAAVEYAKQQHQFLADAKAEGVTMVKKEKQFIWQHPCGGMHLVEAAFAWGTEPGFKKRHLADAEKLADLLFYRLEVETRVYDDTASRILKSPSPELVLNINVQRLKFYGHWLDAMMRLKDLGLWKQTPRRHELVQSARELLAQAVDGLKEDRAGDRMEEFKKNQPQVFLDLIGDSCHAVTGLRESRSFGP